MYKILCKRHYGLINGLVIQRHLSFKSFYMDLISVQQKLANSQVINGTKDYLISWHDWSGMSWGMEIALMTAAIRGLITFPLSISQQKILAKYEALKPEVNRFGHILKKDVDSVAYLYNWSPIKAKLKYHYEMKQEMKRLIIRDNCHPMKASLVVWFQIPIWVIISHSIRNMSFMYPIADHKSQLVYTQLTNEGLLWFPDLTQTDPYYVLPFLTAIINLTIVQMHSNERLRKSQTKTKMHTIVTNLGRTLSVVLIPIGLQMPSSVCFYWFTSSSMGLIQTIVLHSQWFQKHIVSGQQQHNT